MLSHSEYKKKMKKLDKMFREGVSSAELIEIAKEIEAYEDIHYHIESPRRIDMIIFLMDQKDIDASTVTSKLKRDIFKNKKEPLEFNKKELKTLCKLFKVAESVLNGCKP